MAKHRMINTKFWSDPWVMTKLNSLDRLLFLYLISNELTNISGIYEISEHRIAFDTGIERDTLVKAMMPRLEPKVYFKDNWVILVNFTKHQNLKSEDVIKGIKREFELAPKSVQEEAIYRGWGEGLGIAPDTKPNLTKPLVAKATGYDLVPEDSDPEPKRKKKVSPEMQAVFDLFTDNPARLQWRLYESEREAAAILHKEFPLDELKHRYSVAAKYRKEELCPKIHTPSQFLEKMPNMENFLKNHHA